MAHLDDAVVTPALGYIFTAPVGTAIPSTTEIDAYTPLDDAHFTGYHSLGHTSRDDLPQFGFEGGDTETQGTWSNATFREVVTETRADYVTFNALQFDDSVLGIYYGSTDTAGADGVFEVQDTPSSTTERALLVVIVDGPRRVAFHAARSSLRAEDSVELETDAFAAFPIRATFLKNAGSPLYSWVGVAANQPAS